MPRSFGTSKQGVVRWLETLRQPAGASEGQLNVHRPAGSTEFVLRNVSG